MGKKLKALYGNTESYFVGDLNLKLKSLSLPEVVEIDELTSKKESLKAMEKVLFLVIRRSFPKLEDDAENGMSDQEIMEEIKNISVVHVKEIFKKTMTLSGVKLEDDEKKNQINQ
jgi:hypothetical protein